MCCHSFISTETTAIPPLPSIVMAISISTIFSVLSWPCIRWAGTRIDQWRAARAAPAASPAQSKSPSKCTCSAPRWPCKPYKRIGACGACSCRSRRTKPEPDAVREPALVLKVRTQQRSEHWRRMAFDSSPSYAELQARVCAKFQLGSADIDKLLTEDGMQLGDDEDVEALSTGSGVLIVTRTHA